MAIVAVTPQGVAAYTLPDAQAEIDARLRRAFGQDLSLAPQTPQGQLAGLLAVLAVEVGEAVAAVANSLSVDHAAGPQLDAIGSIVGVPRLPAARARATLRLTGTAGANVPAGSRARDTSGSEWASDEPAALSPAGTLVEFTAADPGPNAAPAGTINRIATPVAGWETATNPEPAQPGRDRQTDGDYRRALRDKSALAGLGPVAALEAALADAGATAWAARENNADTAALDQQRTILPHSILVVADGGQPADLTRAVETHRGMGCGVTVAIVGGADPDTAALDLLGNATVTWAGTDYTGLDLTSATTQAAKAAALTALLASAPDPPTVTAEGGRYIAAHRWRPDRAPTFAGAAAGSFKLTAAHADYPQGPYLRPRPRPLAVTAAMTRGDGFPADGVTQVRGKITDRVDAYRIGATVRANDLLVAAESVPGAQVTSIEATHQGADADGDEPPLDAKWGLAAGDLQVTVA